jgi:hypothetical protein
MLALVGCGGGGDTSSDSNAAKIEAAEGQEQSAALIEKTLADKLSIEADSYGDERYVVSGGECSIAIVVTGDQVPLYEESEWVVTAPDGSAAVKVAPVESTPVSECLGAVTSALAWE